MIKPLDVTNPIANKAQVLNTSFCAAPTMYTQPQAQVGQRLDLNCCGGKDSSCCGKKLNVVI
jgi:hypothetical protein